MDTIDSSLLGEGEHFIDEKVPSLHFAIVEHCSVLVLASLSVCAVTDAATTILIEIVKE